MLEEIVTLLEQAERSQNSQPDLSPLTVERVERDGRALLIEPPLVLTPSLDDGPDGLISVELPELSLSAFARTRGALQADIVEELFFLWDDYALDDPAKLVPAAQELREGSI